MADDIQVMHETTDLNTTQPLNNKQVDAATDIGVIIPSAEVLITATIDAAQSSSQKSTAVGLGVVWSGAIRRARRYGGLYSSNTYGTCM